MKCSIPEISWHNKEPVLSVAIQPYNEDFYRLATAGADHYVVIWQLNLCDNGGVKIDALAELTRHQRAVNCVRWSPNGEFLASADDDANIIIWKLKTDNIPLLEGDSGDKETWIIHKILRGHKEDIYDLCWSPNGMKILTGSIDNTAILWDVVKGRYEHILRDHKGFVQGVAWDPKNQYFATISTDRICRIYESSGKQIKARIQKGCLPLAENHDLYQKETKYFHDDTFKSFFRRLDFSQDGSLLAVPSGHVEIEDCDSNFNATYIFTVDNWTEPAAVLPSGKQSSTVVRFCPILFELREDGPEPLVALPYRLVLAIGTDHNVILYDTQQSTPFAYLRDIHYTRLTDLTWSKDGLLLVASSTDGFCALITFEPNELGVQYVKEDSEPEENSLNISGCIDLITENDKLKPKKPSLLETWTIKTPKKNVEDTVPKTSDNKKLRRIQPIPVETKKNDTDLKNEAKPIAVRKKSKSSNETPKKNSLLTFLKTPSPSTSSSGKQRKLEKSNQETVPVIVLDEIEARDAWNCQNDVEKLKENQNVEQTKDENISNNDTEDFSLHLNEYMTTDETLDNNKDDDDEMIEGNQLETNKFDGNCKKDDDNDKKDEMIKENQLETSKIDDDCKKDEYATTNETVDHKKKDEGDKIIEENQLKTDKIDGDCKKSEEIVSNMENKIVLPTKRRIPLTTLSSPKHKKKK